MRNFVVMFLALAALGLAQSAKIGIPDTTQPPSSTVGSGMDNALSGASSAPSSYNQNDPNRGSRQLVFAPIPIASQMIGVGVVPVVEYVFSADPTDKHSQPSTLVGGGFGTSGGSWGLGGGASLNLGHDRYRTTLYSGYARLKYDVFGTGNEAGNEGKSIEVEQKAPAVFAQQLFGFWSGFYLGPRFIWASTTSTFDLSKALPPGLNIQDFTVPITIASLGFNLQHDKRDSIFYPTRGHFFQGTADYHGHAFGSSRVFNTYQLAINKYIPFGDKNVLALRAMGCGVTGSFIPFFAYCQFGQQGDNRGYQAGRYRDVSMFAMQAEWRAILWRRIGGTVFFGVGEVAPDGHSFNWANLLPSGGLGLRYNLLKQGRMNLRSDFAYGNNGFSWSMGIGEVF